MSDPRPIDPRKLAGLGDDSFRAPDLAEAVEGWRAWQVERALPAFGNTPKLRSVTYRDYFWEPRRASLAECSKCPPDKVPGENCTCGFYSAKTFDHLRELAYHDYAQVADTQVAVVGQLACWGKVIEGTQGWRASHAYPVQLFIPHEGWRLAKALRDGYGVPVKLQNILAPDVELAA